MIDAITPDYRTCDYCAGLCEHGEIRRADIQFAAVEVRSPEAFQFLAMCPAHFKAFAEAVRKLAEKVR